MSPSTTDPASQVRSLVHREWPLARAWTAPVSASPPSASGRTACGPCRPAGGRIAILIQRQAARVLLLDARSRLLLLRVHDPIEPRGHWWEVPGGGLEPGEDTAAACRRELAEETGIRLPRVGACVWVRTARFRFGGHDIAQREWIHLAQLTDDVPPLGQRDLDRLEHRAMLGQHWWTMAELTTSNEPFIPAQLASLLGKLLADGPPPHPIDISGPPS
jgi:8-oxo-dGTP pyrophosphatase MutT (NUDIX family)